jgi:GntR family transcriptional regulator/MocR family aminotransferase
LELLVELDRASTEQLHVQVERALRDGIRSGRLRPGSELPSTRGLAGRLGVSRGVVVEAYAQLAAEGYLDARQGARTRVAPGPARGAGDASAPADRPSGEPRYDFHPGLPDVSAFPRAAWLRSTRRALESAPHRSLAYGDVRGAAELREALAAYLGRVRGVVADPGRIVICAGHIQGYTLVCRALRRRGARTIGLEDPGFVLQRIAATHHGLTPVPIAVDAEGLDVDVLARAAPDAVLVTPAHQSPTGAVLSAARRRALLEWAQTTGALVIEDDYDAEFRYDREPVGALQGLDPGRVAYTGSASKTLAPALRLGWFVLPDWLAGEVAGEKAMDDMGSAAIGQLALADFLERGELDRHLRRMRPRYRARREALGVVLARHLPDARLSPSAAGLYSLVELPPGTDEVALVRAAWRLGAGVHGLAPSRFDPSAGPPGLVLGYAGMPEDAIERGVQLIAEAAAASASARRSPRHRRSGAPIPATVR